jgi:hypothetical protein
VPLPIPSGLLAQDAAAVDPMLAELRSATRNGSSLQAAAQQLMNRFLQQFEGSVALGRIYATVPYNVLPQRDRAFVRAAAEQKGMLALLQDDTRVLSLLATAGAEPAWRDRYASKGHLGIPLLSEHFVSEIPMIAGLIAQLGSSVRWFAKVAAPAGRNDNFGVFTESFFVADAGAARDSTGRLLIPAQDFVRSYNIRAVCGVGGEFPSSGMILVCIFFSNETLPHTPKWLLRVPLMLATGAQALVAAGKIYGA